LELETIPLLYEDISHAFVSSLQGTPASCKRLILNRSQSLIKLATLFPRLQFAAFLDDEQEEQDDMYEYADYTLEEAQQFYMWHQHLETYIDFRFSHEIPRFLNTGQFQKLATLELRHVDYGGSWLKGLIKCLKNTPQLRTLKIELFAFGYQDMNDLHENVPLLETLVLENCTITGLGPPHQSTIIPVESMTRLDIIDHEQYTLCNDSLYGFIASKYPKVKYLTLPASKDARFYSSSLRMLLSSDNLIELNLDKDFELLKLTCYVVECLPPNLKKLSLSVECEPLLCEKVLNFVKYSHIVSLTLMQIPATNLNLLNGLSKLNQLELIFIEDDKVKQDENGVVLNKLINELPTSLETFSLSNATITLDQHNISTGWHPSSLKRFELKSCKITDNLSQYLSSGYFPKLDTLVLKDNTTMHPLLLPDQHFSLVDIHLLVVGLRVNVEGDKMYRDIGYIQQPVLSAHFNVHDHAMYTVAIPAAIMYDRYFQFECKSVQTLLYNGLLVLV
jgi:hypothetical protein